MFGSEDKEEEKKDTEEVFAPEAKTSINEILSTTSVENKPTIIEFIALLKNTQSLHHLTAFKAYPPEYRLQIATLLLKLNELSKNEFGFADKESIEKLMTLFARDKTTTLPKRILIEVDALNISLRTKFILDLIYLHAEHSPSEKDFNKKLCKLAVSRSDFLTTKYEAMLKEEIISHHGFILQFSDLWCQINPYFFTEENKIKIFALLKDNPEFKGSAEQRLNRVLKDLKSLPSHSQNQDVLDLLLLNAQFSPENEDFAANLEEVDNLGLLCKVNRDIVKNQILKNKNTNDLRFPFPNDADEKITFPPEVDAFLLEKESQRNMLLLFLQRKELTRVHFDDFLSLPAPVRAALVNLFNSLNQIAPHLINANNLGNVIVFAKSKSMENAEKAIKTGLLYIDDFAKHYGRRRPLDQDNFDLLFFNSVFLDDCYKNLCKIYDNGMLTDNLRDMLKNAWKENRTEFEIILNNDYTLPHIVDIIKKHPGQKASIFRFINIINRFDTAEYRHWFEDNPLALESATAIYQVLTFLQTVIIQQLHKENIEYEDNDLTAKINFRMDNAFNSLKAVFAHPNITNKNKYLSDLLTALKFLEEKDITTNYPLLMNHPEFLEKFVVRLPKIKNKIKNQASFDKYMKENINDILQESLKTPFREIKSEPITDLMATFFFEEKKEEEKDLTTGLTALKKTGDPIAPIYYDHDAVSKLLEINKNFPFLNQKRVYDILEYKDGDRQIISYLIKSLYQSSPASITAEKLGHYLDRVLAALDQNDQLLSQINKYLSYLREHHYLQRDDYSSFEYILKILLLSTSFPNNETFINRFGKLIQKNLLNASHCEVIERAFNQESKEVSSIQYASNQILLCTLSTNKDLTEKDIAIIQKYPKYDEGIANLLQACASWEGGGFSKTQAMIQHWLEEDENIRILANHSDKHFYEIFCMLRATLDNWVYRDIRDDKDDQMVRHLSLLKNNLKWVEDKPTYLEKYHTLLGILRSNIAPDIGLRYETCVSIIDLALSHPNVLIRLDFAKNSSPFSLLKSITALKATEGTQTESITFFKKDGSLDEGKEEKKETLENKEAKSDPKKLP